ncbi:SIR2 family protein, partial [Candidatus Poribacteria bacterium]
MGIPEGLIEQIRNGNCVVFVGAGLSQGAGLPGWPDLLRRMIVWAERHGKAISDRAELEESIKEGDLLLVAEEMHEQMGADDFCAFMEEVFLDQNIKPTESHRHLARIPFAASVTTNYDTLLESAYTLLRDGANVPVITPANYAGLARRLRDDTFYVLKAHGTITNIETVILKRDDYREVMFGNLAYRRHLEILFSTKTVLFIGFSLTDEDVMQFLDELKAVFRGYAGKHYALMCTEKTPSFKQRRFEKDYNIQIIPYSDHYEVPIFLKKLAEKCADEKVEPKPEPATPSFGKLSNV